MFGFSMRRDGVKLNYIDLFSMYHSYIQTLLLGSALCFATSQLSGNNGILVIPDVSVDESTTYDSVMLQLNLTNGTFAIFDVTLKDTSLSPTVLDTIAADGLKVDFHGYVRSGHNQITCMTKVVSTDRDTVINVYPGTNSKLFET